MKLTEAHTTEIVLFKINKWSIKYYEISIK